MSAGYRDRRDAGRRLAAALDEYRGREDVIVLALPRGGVPVAAEVASALGAPLDVFLVRKLGVPGFEELAMGAIASGGVRVLNDDVVAEAGVPPDVIDRVARQQQVVLDERAAAYRGTRPAPDVAGKVAVIVDDGLATGATMRAAVAALRRMSPAEVVVAVPVGAAATCERLEKEADRVVCPLTPAHFQAVGRWYDDFEQTTDDEVRRLLDGG